MSRAPGPDKYARILQDFRTRIVSGVLRPGEQLPARRELEHDCNASRMTLQRVFDTLVREGYLVTRGALGTFVAAAPPSLSRYALAFPVAPDDSSVRWTQFYDSLLRLSAEPRSDGITLEPYLGVDDYGPSHPESLRLQRDVTDLRIAGVIFARLPFACHGLLASCRSDLPMVAISTPGDGASVYLDAADFDDKAAAWLHAQGRRRIAILGLAVVPPRSTTGLLSACQRLGLETRPYWNLQLAIRPAEAASTITRLLMQGSPDERPDGLIITDDHLIEAVTTGLLIAGLRTGLEVDVVGAVNFPYLPATAQPICRLGFDLRELLIIGIEQLRLGTTSSSRHRYIPARFADEVPGRVLLSGNPV